MLKTNNSASVSSLNRPVKEEKPTKSASSEVLSSPGRFTRSPLAKKPPQRVPVGSPGQENRPVVSPNRSKYANKLENSGKLLNKLGSGKEVLGSKVLTTRNPLSDRTNKSMVKAVSTPEKSKQKNDSLNEVKFEDLFNLTSETSASASDTSFLQMHEEVPNAGVKRSTSTLLSTTTSSRTEELTRALADTLKENEILHDTVTLLKSEVTRLMDEVDELREYSELYLMAKELIEEQQKEIAELRAELVN